MLSLIEQSDCSVNWGLICAFGQPGPHLELLSLQKVYFLILYCYIKMNCAHNKKYLLHDLVQIKVGYKVCKVTTNMSIK